MGYTSFFTKKVVYIRIFLPRRNTLLYNSQIHYRDSNLCFQTHQQIGSLLCIRFEVDCQNQQTYCLSILLLDYSLANLFMILVVVSHLHHIGVPALYSFESCRSACFV